MKCIAKNRATHWAGSLFATHGLPALVPAPPDALKFSPDEAMQLCRFTGRWRQGDTCELADKASLKNWHEECEWASCREVNYSKHGCSTDAEIN